MLLHRPLGTNEFGRKSSQLERRTVSIADTLPDGTFGQYSGGR